MNNRFVKPYKSILSKADLLGYKYPHMVSMPDGQALALREVEGAITLCLYDLDLAAQPIYLIWPNMAEGFQEGDVSNIEKFLIAADRELGKIVGDVYRHG